MTFSQTLIFNIFVFFLSDCVADTALSYILNYIGLTHPSLADPTELLETGRNIRDCGLTDPLGLHKAATLSESPGVSAV